MNLHSGVGEEQPLTSTSAGGGDTCRLGGMVGYLSRLVVQHRCNPVKEAQKKTTVGSIHLFFLFKVGGCGDA